MLAPTRNWEGASLRQYIAINSLTFVVIVTRQASQITPNKTLPNMNESDGVGMRRPATILAAVAALALSAYNGLIEV